MAPKSEGNKGKGRHDSTSVIALKNVKMVACGQQILEICEKFYVQKRFSVLCFIEI
jgi:hypothetical protein